MAFCTEFVPCGTIRTVHTTYAAALKTTTHAKTLAQKTTCCNSKSNAPVYGHMYPKHVELRIHQQKTLLHQVGISLYFITTIS
jgi:hypothetical protein